MRTRNDLKRPDLCTVHEHTHITFSKHFCRAWQSTALCSAVWDGATILIQYWSHQVCLILVWKKRCWTKTYSYQKKRYLLKNILDCYEIPKEEWILDPDANADQLGAVSSAAFTVWLLPWVKNSQWAVSFSMGEKKNGQAKMLSVPWHVLFCCRKAFITHELHVPLQHTQSTVNCLLRYPHSQSPTAVLQDCAHVSGTCTALRVRSKWHMMPP